MKSNILTIVFAVILLGACATDGFTPKSTVRVVTTETYPEFPNVEPLGDPGLIPWRADVPRNKNKITVKNISSCVKVPEEERDSSFWTRCGENPIVTDTNIYIGFDQENWNILVNNFNKLKEWIHRYEERIKEINKQRAEWRKKAEEARNKVKAEEAKTNESN